MTRQSPRRSSNATTRFLAAAGLVALLGGMAFIVMGETGDDGGDHGRSRDDDDRDPSPPPVKKPPRADQDRRHRGRRLRPGGRPVRERRRRQARDRRQRHDGLEDRALPDDVQQVGRRPRARRRQAGEGVARRRHDRDAGLRRPGAGREFADRSVHVRLRVEDDRGAHDLCTEASSAGATSCSGSRPCPPTAWLP